MFLLCQTARKVGCDFPDLPGGEHHTVDNQTLENMMGSSQAQGDVSTDFARIFALTNFRQLDKFCGDKSERRKSTQNLWMPCFFEMRNRRSGKRTESLPHSAVRGGDNHTDET